MRDEQVTTLRALYAEYGRIGLLLVRKWADVQLALKAILSRLKGIIRRKFPTRRFSDIPSAFPG